jgi:hypothetical protein
MARSTVFGCKRTVAYRVEQVLLRTAMRIMTGDARIRAWFDSLVSIEKTLRRLIMTLGTQGSSGLLC